jgi:hypothetical protein
VLQFRGVELLQPPAGRPRRRPWLTVGSQRQRFGADQFDLLTAALEFRANPHVAIGRDWTQQVHRDPAQPGVVAWRAAFQRADQQRRHRRGMLNRRGPGAADQVCGSELFA